MAKRTVRANYDLESMNLIMALLSPETKYDDEGNELDPEVLHSLTFSFEELPEEIQRKSSLFGLHQLLVQRSGPTGTTTEEKKQNMEDVYRQLVEGQWSARATGGIGGSIPLAARALARVKDVSESVAYNTWKELDKETKEALKANPKIVSAMEEIKSEAQEAPSLSLDDLVS